MTGDFDFHFDFDLSRYDPKMAYFVLIDATTLVKLAPLY